jgi:outer membrane protein TolC
MAGMPLDTTIMIDTASMISSVGGDTNSTEFRAENVPLYQTLLKQSDLNRQQVKLSIAQYFPTVAGFGLIKRYANNTEYKMEKWDNTSAIGIAVSMPLFTSGVNYSKVKQSQLRLQQLEEDISQLKDFLKVQFDNAVLEYQTANELLEAQKANRILAQKVYNQTSLQYQEGMASLADPLNVNSDYLQADNSYSQQILKCKISEIKMLKASGKLKRLMDNN